MMNLRWKIAQALEIRWWQYYLSKREVKDYLGRKKLYWEKILKKISLSLHQEDTMLDVGCGPAGIFIALPQYSINAVDPLINRYEEDLDHFSKDWYPWVQFYPLPLEKFQSSSQYDKVFCLNAINHVNNLSVCLKQLSKLTKTGGTLVLSIDTHNFSFFKLLFRLIPGDILHPHQYDIEEYCRMLEVNDFSIQKIINLKKGFLFDYQLILANKQGER